MQKSFRTLLSLGLGVVAATSLTHSANAQTYGRSPYSNNDDVRYGNFGRVVTLEGVVTEDSTDQRFQVRAGGETFDVKSDRRVLLHQGDRIVLRGSFDNNNDFNAQSIQFVGSGRDWNGDNNAQGNDYRPGADNFVDFPATVTRLLSRDELEVRGDNGRVYRVETRGNADSVRVGTRLRVSGQARGDQIFEARLGSISSNGYGYSGSGYGNDNNGYGGYGGNNGYGNNSNWNTQQTVDFPGRITSVDRSRNQAVVRGDNGRDYAIRGSAADDFRVGTRVRVRGVARYGLIELRDLDPIR